MPQLLDAVFTYLFKYPRIVYERGELVWAGSWSFLGLALALVVGIGLVAWSYRWARSRASSGAALGLVAIRSAGLGILVICLFRPTLVLSTAVPQQNVVAVLVDDTRSMTIPDMEDRSRGDVAHELLGDLDSPLLRALQERFVVRHFGFASQATRLSGLEDLSFQGDRTLIGRGLEFVQQDLSSVPLSGIVLVTDGGDHDRPALDDALLRLRAEGIPVHVVGVGGESLAPDVEIERVDIPRSVLQGSAVTAEVVVGHSGYAGRRVPVRVEEDGRILASEEVELPSDGGSVTLQLPLVLEEPGVRRLRARVPAQPGEILRENNHRDLYVRVRDGRDKILYYEGQPRFEVGFLRRALEDDENLQLVVLQRTGEERFVRLDVDDGDELAGGFPRSREELFEYRGLILGSVEASAFTPEQMRMIADFVDRRGGGLLVLGGAHSLGEGGYAGTALDPLLPLVPAGSASAESPEQAYFAQLRIGPTESGARHPVLPFGAADDGEAAEPTSAGVGALAAARRPVVSWDDLPPLTTVNRLGEARAGATVLLTGDDVDRPGSQQPVLAYQRYGAGLSVVLSVHDTWLWQMHGDIPLEDRTHETFWRQLLRWLVQDAPHSLEVRAVRDRVAPDEPVGLIARVRSDEFLPVNGATVTGIVTDPFGNEETIRLSWSVERDGEYRGSFLPQVDGPFEIRIQAEDESRRLTAPPIHVEAGVHDAEFQNAAMRVDLLRRIAEETGGAFYTPETTEGLPEALRYSDRGTVVQEERDLWDLPVFFFLLVGLLSTEWFLRRRLGLA